MPSAPQRGLKFCFSLQPLDDMMISCHCGEYLCDRADEGGGDERGDGGAEEGGRGEEQEGGGGEEEEGRAVFDRGSVDCRGQGNSRRHSGNTETRTHRSGGTGQTTIPE